MTWIRVGRRPGIRRFLVQFLVLNAVIFVIGAVPATAVGIVVARSQAVRATAIAARAAADSIAAPLCTPELLRGEPAALEAMDRVIRHQIRSGMISRVKVWTAEGRILYSDAASLIGRSFELESEEKALLGTNGVRAQISALKNAENAFEVQAGQLVESYVGIRDTAGRPLLFEAYFTVERLNADTRVNAWNLVPIALVGMLVLLLMQMPVSLVLGRRLDRAHNRHARLLSNAALACDLERGRIARQLRGRVVQDLAGVAYLLGYLQLRRPGAGDAAVESAVQAAQRANRIVRDDVQLLNRTIVELDTPQLFQTGLEACVYDLTEPLRHAGVHCDVQVADTSGLPELTVRLLYRAARELLRSVAEHGSASHVLVYLTVTERRAVLTVTDNGSTSPAATDTGSRPASAFAGAEVGPPGALSLYLLSEAVRDAAGVMSVDMTSTFGTTVRVTLGPAPLRLPRWIKPRWGKSRARR